MLIIVDREKMESEIEKYPFSQIDEIRSQNESKFLKLSAEKEKKDLKKLQSLSESLNAFKMKEIETNCQCVLI